jgi:MraZ protein
VVECVKKGVKMGSSDSNVQSVTSGLGVFFGEFQHSLDPKKRLTIPSEWRAQVSGPQGLFVLPDFYHKCLNIFPAAVMAEKMEKMRKHSMSDRKAMEFLRILGSASDLVSWDGQGRIRVKDRLLEFAGLEDQVLMVGAMAKFQLWKPENCPDTGEIDQSQLAEAGRYIDF